MWHTGEAVFLRQRMGIGRDACVGGKRNTYKILIRKPLGIRGKVW